MLTCLQWSTNHPQTPLISHNAIHINFHKIGELRLKAWLGQKTFLLTQILKINWVLMCKQLCLNFTEIYSKYTDLRTAWNYKWLQVRIARWWLKQNMQTKLHNRLQHAMQISTHIWFTAIVGVYHTMIISNN